MYQFTKRLAVLNLIVGKFPPRITSKRSKNYARNVYHFILGGIINCNKNDDLSPLIKHQNWEMFFFFQNFKIELETSGAVAAANEQIPCVNARYIHIDIDTNIATHILSLSVTLSVRLCTPDGLYKIP